jgi:hypothetical protein
MPNYSIYPGTFICHTCKEEVKTLRLYAATMEATWMCKNKHISKVSFANKKKSDYEREK